MKVPDLFKVRKYSLTSQFLVSFTLIAVIVVSSYISVDLIGYRVVALVLLMAVSILAMFFDIFPVVTTAVLSAFIWNYFFIPPTFTLHIGTPEDALMFLMYFLVALINTVLTIKIREFEKKSRDKEEKEKTIRLYNTLLNSLSHELRTPISTIIGAIDTIRENDQRLSTENRNELYNEIEVAQFRLNRQVENLLNMSRLEAGVLRPKSDWCDVNELIYIVIDSNKRTPSTHKIVFDPNEDLPLFKIDRGLVEQVLLNIFHNALQYTPEGSSVKFEVEQDGRNCRFILSDSGKGFSEDEAQSIFDKFYRIPNSAPGGTGLGLSIARGFTEALNGKIQVQNSESGGARFIVEIPAETSSLNALKNE
ncbi:MAG: sensor histidine kinase [Bacteroidia bacterium]